MLIVSPAQAGIQGSSLDVHPPIPYHAPVDRREPLYLSLHRAGELRSRVEEARQRLVSCELCARRCGVDRLKGELGYCRAPLGLVISSAGPHFGEEPPLTGRRGSGTIFLTYCSLGCLFCQNWDISHLHRGAPLDTGGLAAVMLRLQQLGCHNVNFVTPTHYLPQILEALPTAIDSGLTIPLVWNCGGYERVASLKLLEGIVDIYLPDFKFADREAARKYCRAPDYPERAREALLEMQRQVGDLEVDDEGIARRGLLIRHLIMPGMSENTRQVLDFIAREISTEAWVNLMDQYHPAWKAGGHPEIARPITDGEYREAAAYARSLGLHRGF